MKFRSLLKTDFSLEIYFIFNPVCKNEVSYLSCCLNLAYGHSYLASSILIDLSQGLPYEFDFNAFDKAPL